jgi:hypothetical protein
MEKAREIRVKADEEFAIEKVGACALCVCAQTLMFALCRRSW